MDRQNVTLQKKHTFMLQRITWYRERGCKRTPKSFDLSKIRAKSLKRWAKMAANVVWFQQMAPNISRKTHEDLCLEVIPKMIFYLCGEILLAKSHKTFRARLGNLGKNLSHPQKFPSPKPMYIYRFLNQIWMVFRHKRNRKTFWVVLSSYSRIWFTKLRNLCFSDFLSCDLLGQSRFRLQQ